MTLFRQIASFISVLFLTLMLFIAWNNFQQSANYLQGQLQTTAQDMTTTLGITLANGDNATDPVMIETLFNSIFDSGYYSRIELRDMDDKIIHAKSQPVVIHKVPDWFVTWIKLEGATGKTLITRDWLPFGILSLSTHPGYAYAQLYANLKATLWWFSSLTAMGLVLLWWILKLLMRPLHRVQEQAEAIQNNAFVYQEKIPRTLELRHVVNAMNRMVHKVKSIFDEQADTLQRYHHLLYNDEATGIGNRRFFTMRLKELQNEEGITGALAMVRIQNIEAVNEQHGYAAGDAMLATLTHLLRELAEKQHHSLAARLNNLDFALLLDTTAHESQARIQALHEAFARSQARDLKGDQQPYLVSGIIDINPRLSQGQALAGLDTAILQAQATAAYAITLSQQGEQALGKQQWREKLLDALKNDRFELVAQAVQDSGKIFHQEIYIRLHQEHGRPLNAGAFLPIAHALKLSTDIDKWVFARLPKVATSDKATPWAINLSEEFVEHGHANFEFEKLLDSFNIGSGQKLHIEVRHSTFNRLMNATIRTGEMVRAKGHLFGIDAFETGSNLRLLQQIRPDYIKINAHRLLELNNNDQVALQALRTLAASLGIRIIATGIDTEKLRETMKELGISLLQGNAIGAPHEIA